MNKTIETSATPDEENHYVYVEVGSLHEYAGNPRVNDHAVDAMAALIQAHGFRVPVLVTSREDGGYDLVDGHLRLKAARKLGMDEIPAFTVDDMSEDQIKAFRISVNKAAELADWDMGKLKNELANLKVPTVNLAALTGMDEAALKSLTQPPVKVTPPANGPVSKAADKRQVTQDTDAVTLKLDMTLAQRTDAEAKLEKFRVDNGLPTKSAAFLRLLAEYTKDAAGKAPEEAPKTTTTGRRKRQ